MGVLCTCCIKSKRKDIDEGEVVKSVGNKQSLILNSKVPSGSMAYNDDSNEAAELATFGAGCYWGTENWYVQKFDHRDGLIGYAVGFMSNDPNAIKNPSYNHVCSGTTGHVEVFHIRFDSSKVSYEQLVRHLFVFHDPTTMNRQEND